MKKILVLLLCVWIIQSCATTQKQTDSEKTMKKSIDAVAGVGIADVTGGKSWQPKMGGQFGVEKSLFKLNGRTSVHGGIGISSQGAAYEEEMFSGKVNMTYVNVPLLYTYESSAGFYAEAGFQPSILIMAKDKFDGGNYNYKDSMHPFDLGLPVGAGYRINEQFSVGFRATFGLLNSNNSINNVNDHNFLFNAILHYNLELPCKNTSDKE